MHETVSCCPEMTRRIITLALAILMVTAVTLFPMPSGVSAVSADKSTHGTGMSWGSNNNGQLGDGSTAEKHSPVPISGLTGAVTISAGGQHSLALKSDGTVWSWGWNDDGQLGDGSYNDRSTPGQVAGLTGAVAVAGGGQHSLALKSDGTVWAWGHNDYGELGDGSTTNRNAPVQVSGLTGAVAVAAGGSHSLAVKSDGTTWAWGWNYWSQLGDGSFVNRTAPVQVSGLTGSVAVEAGAIHSLALKSDGTVWTWGENSYGQLGDGSTTNRTAPVQTSGLTGAVAIEGGAYHSLALKSDGTAWAWGYNEYGQLGDTSTTSRNAPVQASGLIGAVAVAAGNTHSLAIVCDSVPGTSWGRNESGQLGDDSTTDRLTPAQVSGLTGAVAVAGGVSHSLALKSDGTVQAWGYNNEGQLGDKSNDDRHTPVQVFGLSGAVAVAAGNLHSLALKSDGTVWAWGYNGYGQLGDDSTKNSNAPLQVKGLSGAVAVAAGAQHSLALKSDGTVWAWGCNDFGQLGDDSTKNSNVPVQVNGLSGAVALAGGMSHSLAIKSDGTAWTWGYNEYGQLGDGTCNERHTPVQVLELAGAVAIAGGRFYSMALKSDGKVWAWGDNYYGQLGDGSYDSSKTPVQVSGLAGAVAISGGAHHCLAIKSDGTAWAWGYNEFGQLGDGSTTHRNVPVQVSGLTNAVVVAGASYHSLALRTFVAVSSFFFAEGSCRPGVDSFLCIQNPGDTVATVQITYMKGDKTTETKPAFTIDPKSRKTVSVAGELYGGVHANDDAHDFSAKVESDQPIVAERPMYFNFYGWNGGHNVMGATSPASSFYFAEGSCRPGVDSFLCIQNPGNTVAQVQITYMQGDGQTVVKTPFPIDPKSRETVSVANDLYGGVHANDDAHDFSCKVESTGSNIIAERPMYFNFYGWNGGHNVMGATSPALSFYFAEGSCRPGVDSFLCIQNPSETETANVTITYMKGDGTTYIPTEPLTVDPKSRRTVSVTNELYGGVHANDDAHDFSAKVTSNQPIVAERPMYFNFYGWNGGHNVMGATSPADIFLFAEGSCRPGVDSFLCIQNPGNEAATVQITFMKGDGTTSIPTIHTIGPKSRWTVSVANELYGGVHANDDAHDFSAMVRCTTEGQKIICERPVYFNFYGWNGGHNVMGFPAEIK